MQDKKENPWLRRTFSEISKYGKMFEQCPLKPVSKRAYNKLKKKIISKSITKTVGFIFRREFSS